MKHRVWTMGSMWVILLLSLLFLPLAGTVGAQGTLPPPLDDGSPSTELETADQETGADTSMVKVETAGSTWTVEFGNPPDPGTGNCYPFGCVISGYPGTHYQQVYDAAQFPGPGTIDKIRFFNTQLPGAVFQEDDYEIRLSTTSKPVNGLDTVNLFNNVGPDETLFYSAHLSGLTGPVINFDGTGFSYDPSEGNLLVDVRRSTIGGSGYWGYLDARNGSFANASSRAHNFGPAGYVRNYGLRTAFDFESGNQPPIADANGPYSGDEGSPISLDGTGSTDPDGDPLTYSWSVDDSSLCSFNDATSPTPELTCTDNGGFAVTLEVDDGQATHSDETSVTVSNVAPGVSIDSVSPALLAVGESVIASGSFTDPGTNDTHTAEWDWGDTVLSAGTVSGLNVGPDSHTYSAAGIYTIQLTVTDDDSDAGTADYQFVVVYDPSAGFVTGGGWIYSEPGAYLPDPELEGKANFGFVSKYKKGATTPTGNTQFQFHAAGLRFHSTSYQWLVVTGSNYAKFKGTGTINGMGEYKFMLWAGDDDPDTFRIKIWEEDEYGDETVTYDNGFDQALGGGSIVIHTKKK